MYPQEEVTSEYATTAKAVNFGIVYGISDYGLIPKLRYYTKRSSRIYRKVFRKFPRCKRIYGKLCKKQKKKDYVTTILNRRRYLPDITSSNFNLRSFAERTAMNTPIQGSAADIIKKAMIDMDARIEQEGLQDKIVIASTR